MRSIVFIAAAALAAPASAEILSASQSGFEVRETVPLVVPPEAAFAAFTNIGAWWDRKHTYSGDSANLSLVAAPGGCFCERFPKTGGGIEHLRVSYLEPGKRIVLTGALGPLLFEAVSGVMSIEVKTIAGGSELSLDYKAAGFANGGGGKLASDTDAVLAAQMKRFRTYAAALPRS